MNHTYPYVIQQISILNQLHENVDFFRIPIDFVDMDNVRMFNLGQNF